MANTYLTRTMGTPTNVQKCTVSQWVKFGALGSSEQLFETYQSASQRITIYRNASNQLYYYDPASSVNIVTTRVFRDTSAWYHIVYSVDTTQGTASDRVKLYVNGVQETVFGTNATYGVNNNTGQGSGFINVIGHYHGAGSNKFTGSMSYVAFVDGTALAPTVFGSTDSTTGEWKINTSPSFTPGTNGFLILKNGNSLTDESTNTNNFTLGGGTLTKTEDNPSNVFATMNALSKSLSNVVLSKGNTIIRNDSGNDGNVLGTIALGNGKYYWETYKYGGGNTGLGITLASVDGSNHAAIHGSRVNYYQDGYIYQNGFGLSDINTGVTYSDTDIISVSVDTENGTIKFYKNGVLVNNSSQTNSVFTYAQNELIPFWYCSNGGEWRTNLGNGYFGTTAVSSAGTNASENGIFEYAVQPTDATALSTKGLNL